MLFCHMYNLFCWDLEAWNAEDVDFCHSALKYQKQHLALHKYLHQPIRQWEGDTLLARYVKIQYSLSKIVKIRTKSWKCAESCLHTLSHSGDTQSYSLTGWFLAVPVHLLYQNEEEIIAQPTRSFFTFKVYYPMSCAVLRAADHKN